MTLGCSARLKPCKYEVEIEEMKLRVHGAMNDAACYSSCLFFSMTVPRSCRLVHHDVRFVDFDSRSYHVRRPGRYESTSHAGNLLVSIWNVQLRFGSITT